MKEEIAIRVINEIKNNPGIHYIELREKTKDYLKEEALYRVLYALTEPKKERRIIKNKETDRHGCKYPHSLEKSTFEFVFDKENLMEQLKKQFIFWKLSD